MNARALVLAALFAAGAAAAGQAQAGSGAPSMFCDRKHELTAGQQDRLLRVAAVVRDELEASGDSTVLISRSGLDLERFHIRYSHAAIATRGDDGWTARQLYYACDESRPRIYDQGLAGFTMGIDNPALGYVAIVRMPAGAGQSLRAAALDNPRSLRLLAAAYSANAYPYSTRYQNCNQWVAEMFASAWGGLEDGEQLRERAQDWLRSASYAPEPVDVGSHLLMFAAPFVPLLHLDDHPQDDLYAMQMKISLPAALEAFVHQRVPESERVEVCHNGRQIVVHRGWTPVADGCQPADGDRVIPFD
jgi:hypothetical protein